jgi:2-polyprenyl-3-methyl-5-hydroxy-6-metoxy-1,4-benzoquinol methylase
MKPDDLLEFNRWIYTDPRVMEYWGHDAVDNGLSVDEAALLSEIPVREGKLLLLGVGGGREAIPLALLGFEVTGVDFVPEMVEKAKENATRQGLQIEVLIQNVSEIESPSEFYDIIWFSTFMYSFVPTRKRRVRMLKKIRMALKSDGYCVCQYYLNTRNMPSRRSELIKRFLAFVTLGNSLYEKGDMLLNNMGYTHAFLSEDELRSELEEGGFDILHMHTSERIANGGAVSRKKL